jgi:hypothetical protein
MSAPYLKKSSLFLSKKKKKSPSRAMCVWLYYLEVFGYNYIVLCVGGSSTPLPILGARMCSGLYPPGLSLSATVASTNCTTKYGLGGTAIPVRIICWQWIGGWCWREQQQARLASSSAFFLLVILHVQCTWLHHF